VQARAKISLLSHRRLMPLPGAGSAIAACTHSPGMSAGIARTRIEQESLHQGSKDGHNCMCCQQSSVRWAPARAPAHRVRAPAHLATRARAAHEHQQPAQRAAAAGRIVVARRVAAQAAAQQLISGLISRVACARQRPALLCRLRNITCEQMGTTARPWQGKHAVVPTTTATQALPTECCTDWIAVPVGGCKAVKRPEAAARGAPGPLLRTDTRSSKTNRLPRKKPSGKASWYRWMPPGAAAARRSRARFWCRVGGAFAHARSCTLLLGKGAPPLARCAVASTLLTYPQLNTTVLPAPFLTDSRPAEMIAAVREIIKQTALSRQGGAQRAQNGWVYATLS